MTYPTDENEHDVIGEEYKGEASDGESDIESDESRGSPTGDTPDVWPSRTEETPCCFRVRRMMNRFLSCQALLKLSVSVTNQRGTRALLQLALNLRSPTLQELLHPRLQQKIHPSWCQEMPLQKGICHLHYKRSTFCSSYTRYTIIQFRSKGQGRC